MMLIGLLLIFGLALSAFFSGSETGFYRVTRVRLVMDAKDGKRIAQALLWMVNHPSVVVATVLIGNNLANYCISLGGVLLSSRWLAESSRWEFLVPLVATPLVFVYGELLPKYLFFQTPYRLLRWAAPLMMVCTVLFLPLSLFVFAFEAIRGWLSGDSSTITSFALGRQDIQRTIAESHEAGVVVPIQRDLAQNLFSFGARPVRQFAVPLRAVPVVEVDAGRQPALDAANRWNSPLVVVANHGRLIGCCLASELRVDLANPQLPVLPICEAQANEASIQVLTRLQAMHAPLAHVVDGGGRGLGIVTRERLTNLLVASEQRLGPR